tara:strand:+ start:2161 stop:3141 length:981 start_codon:yes stop_codon:yes gene_type:complete
VSCNYTFNSGNFHNLEKDYYSEVTNAGGGKYNTYADFVSGSKSDGVLSDFEYETPFNFVPSYGSSVSINFISEIMEYGDGYVRNVPRGLNRILFSMSLDFNDRSNDESENIVDYISERKGSNKFPFQIKPKSNYSSSESYKSLYSLKPYFVQEFLCQQAPINIVYTDNNSISLDFLNDEFSALNIKSILYVESMPAEEKSIIDEYRQKYVLDIEPSVSLSRDISLRNQSFQNNQSKSFFAPDGENIRKEALRLNFEKIDDTKLLKLLSFFIHKQAVESFTFTVKKPSERTAEFMCDAIEHTYLYKGVHSLSVSIYEVPVKKRFIKC